MAYYVDVAVTGIQRYLARTPKLKWRRGTSAALAEAAREIADESLPGSGSINGETGEVDGVVSLVLTDPGDRDRVVSAVLGILRQKLPGAVFQVAEGAGETYLAAYVNELKPRIVRGEVQQDLPAGTEFPGLQTCGLCRVDPAVTLRELGDGDSRYLCADCLMRDSRESTEQRRTAEKCLRSEVGGDKLRLPEGFDELVTLGRNRRTHLATIYADGNRVGHLINELATQEPELAGFVIEMLPMITWEALKAATCAVRAGRDEVLCVVPHVVGGDDVLVSLPADRTWRFVREFLDTFHRHMGDLVDKQYLTLPTMSAGIVFSRANYPFSAQVDAAAQCLREAKSAGAGRSAWVQFTDATAEGTAGPGQPVPHAALKEYEHCLDDLAELPAHHQGQLAQALRRNGAHGARSLAARLGRRSLLDGFADATPWPGPYEHSECQLGLAEALRIARWWS